MKKRKFLIFTITLFIALFLIFKFQFGYSVESSIGGALPIPFWLTIIYLIIIWIHQRKKK